MSYDQSVSDHYRHGNLLDAIEKALPGLEKNRSTVTIDDLAPVDEFHIGGRVATDHLIDQLVFSEDDHVLDVGCGLGGAARYVATRYGSRVTGVDLSLEYVETGKALGEWLKLGDRVILRQGSALSMPFADGQFDGAYMLHVGMNIEDKSSLFSEVHRVLRPGARFGVYDIMRQEDGDLVYPVPWATESTTSKLTTAEMYKRALRDAGFKVEAEQLRRDFALDFFRQLREKTAAAGGPPPLGLHTLMQGTTAAKIKNMIDNIAEGLIAPVEIIARKSDA